MREAVCTTIVIRMVTVESSAFARAIGPRLRALREESGHSIREVASAVGASKAHLWALEVGRSANPTVDLLQRLADYYSVPLVSLFDARKLSDDPDFMEARLLSQFARLNDRDRRAVLTLVEVLGGGDQPGNARASRTTEIAQLQSTDVARDAPDCPHKISE